MKYQQYCNPLHILGHIESNYLSVLDFPEDHHQETVDKCRNRLEIITPFLNQFNGSIQLKDSELIYCCQVVADFWDI